jgi:hypothetical protein
MIEDTTRNRSVAISVGQALLAKGELTPSGSWGEPLTLVKAAASSESKRSVMYRAHLCRWASATRARTSTVRGRKPTMKPTAVLCGLDPNCARLALTIPGSAFRPLAARRSGAPFPIEQLFRASRDKLTPPCIRACRKSSNGEADEKLIFMP